MVLTTVVNIHENNFVTLMQFSLNLREYVDLDTSPKGPDLSCQSLEGKRKCNCVINIISKPLKKSCAIHAIAFLH